MKAILKASLDKTTYVASGLFIGMQQLVMPAIELFIKKYPEVDLEILATHDDLNLTAREADIALRATDSPPENLVGKRITTLAFAVYGNKKLFKKAKNNFSSAPRIYRTSELSVMYHMAK